MGLHYNVATATRRAATARCGLEKFRGAAKVPRMTRTARRWTLLCLLAWPLVAAAAEPPAAAAVEIARSSLLTLSGSAGPSALELSLRRTAEQAPLVVSEFATSIDGKTAPATRNPAGGWSVPLGSLGAGDHKLAVTVGHDGIRELLEGTFTPAVAAPAGGIGSLGGNHKQLLWWILNIGIVLVAAFAISRRMS